MVTDAGYRASSTVIISDANPARFDRTFFSQQVEVHLLVRAQHSLFGVSGFE
jgi:hypothetical protein